MMHHIHLQQCSEYMRDLVTSTATGATRSGLRSASGVYYRKHVVHKKFSELAFSYTPDMLLGTQYLPVCNQPPTLIILSVKLKTHLFTEAFQSFYRFNCF